MGSQSASNNLTIRYFFLGHWPPVWETESHEWNIYHLSLTYNFHMASAPRVRAEDAWWSVIIVTITVPC
jgi:hypothetical protein